MEAFVYIWKNKITKKEYIGYHKGTIDDGYISSSTSKIFWSDYQNGLLEREIVFFGTMKECIELESNLLKDKDSSMIYNLNRNGKIIFTEEVLEKMRNKHLGRKQSEEHIKNRSISLKGRKGGFKGKSHSEETLEKMRSVKRSNEHKLAISSSIKGRVSPTKGTKQKQKECPNCKRMISVNTFTRWHGENCKKEFNNE